MKLKKVGYFVAGLSTAVALLLQGCGGSDNSNNTGLTKTRASDPYIVNARFYVDSTPNGKYDEGEQLSSLTDENGYMTWSSAVPIGATIRMHPNYMGEHNGQPYTGPLLSAKISSSGMITPLTLLKEKGLSDEQIKTMLKTCGLTDLPTDFDVNANPMSIASSTSLDSNTSLATIRAAIAVNGMLKIMEGSTALKNMSGDDIYRSATTDGKILNTIFKKLISGVNSGLNKELMDYLSNSNSALTTAGLPKIPTEVVINTAVTIMDKIVEVGYNTCNATDGNITAIVAAINSKLSSIISQRNILGPYYYGVYLKRKGNYDNYINALSSYVAQHPDATLTNIISGYQTTGSISLDDNGNIITQKANPTTLVSDWNVTKITGAIPALAIDLNNTRGVAYDPKRDVIYIAHDGNISGGVISKLSADGNISSPLSVGKWITGLYKPTSLAVLGDYLFVADYNTTRIFALNDMNMTGNNSVSDADYNFVNQNSSEILKDIAVDRGGNIYVSIESGDKLYKFNYDSSSNKYSAYTDITGSTAPYSLYNLESGLYGNLIIGNTDLNKLVEPSNIKNIVSSNSQNITKINSITLYSKDGTNGIYLVADNNKTIKVVYEVNGSVVDLTNGDMGANQAGDITYIKKRNLLIVPTEANSTIRAFKVQ